MTRGFAAIATALMSGVTKMPLITALQYKARIASRAIELSTTSRGPRHGAMGWCCSLSLAAARLFSLAIDKRTELNCSLRPQSEKIGLRNLVRFQRSTTTLSNSLILHFT